MKKLTKKRLKAIKGYLDFIQFEYDRQGYISTNTADELIEYCKYFIEQVEQLQQENEHLKKFLSWEQEEAQGLDEEVTFQLERLKQAQAKAERYKEIINLFKTAFENGDAEHRTINGRSVQAMALIEEMEGDEK